MVMMIVGVMADWFALPQHWLTELEILAMVFAAAIHDFEHTGTTNNFHIQTRCVVTIRSSQWSQWSVQITNKK